MRTLGEGLRDGGGVIAVGPSLGDLAVHNVVDLARRCIGQLSRQGHAGMLGHRDGRPERQLRTIDLARVTAHEVGGEPRYVTDPAVRRRVRAALAHHLGLDVPAAVDGAASPNTEG
jgi:hypothetical protein